MQGLPIAAPTVPLYRQAVAQASLTRSGCLETQSRSTALCVLIIHIVSELQDQASATNDSRTMCGYLGLDLRLFGWVYKGLYED